MDPLANCFVDEVRNPITVLDLLPDGPQDPLQTPTPRQLSTLQELRSHLDRPSSQDFSCRFISICQRTSWGKLQVTRPMLDLIASRHNIGSSFWDLPSCFYSCNKDVEQAFCVPFTHTANGPWTEISYSIRYAEFRPGDENYDDRWALRHTAIYHSFNADTRQNVFILFSPMPNSKGHRLTEEYLQRLPPGPAGNPYHLHEVLFSAYMPSWRQYMASHERAALQIIDTTFASYIDKPLNYGYDNLNALVVLENKFLKAVTLVTSTQDLLSELVVFLDTEKPQADTSNLIRQLQNHRRRCTAYSTAARHLKDRAQTTAQLLADTLSFRDQVISKEQNSNMLQLNRSAVFITILTLIYVPASFSATFFGMNFFAMDTERSRIVGTPMVWIFILSTLGLTCLTIVFYYWLMQHDGVPFPRLAPKVSLRPDIKGLTRRWTRQNTGLENDLPI